MTEEIKKDDTLDLRGVGCPMNFVKAKLKLESMKENDVLELYLDDGEPIRNVTRSIKEEGYKILDVKPEGETAFRLLVRKTGGQ